MRSAKAVLRRRRIDAALDRLRFALDTFPRSRLLSRLSHRNYQPLPWVGLTEGSRADGTWTRWRAIEGVLDSLPGLRTAVDIGANAGFFTINLARRGLASVAVENDPVAGRTSLYAMRRTGLASTAALLTLEVGPATAELVPAADVVLFLSVWHHLVRGYGLEQATELLRSIWARTHRVLFFDTGEREMPPSFGLPAMEPDADTWLRGYLAETCAGGEVRHLGAHAAFDAAGASVERNLYAVVRPQPA
ncbi:MAG: hypothetical protein ACM33B_12740 [Pseudomonadota bacterium]